MASSSRSPRVEEDGLIQPVEKLRPEHLPQLPLKGGLLPLPRACPAGKAQRGAGGQPLAPYVGGHHQDGVAEVGPAAVGIGEHPILHDLQEQAPHVGVGLFQLVEEEDGVGVPPDRLGELPPLLVAPVARESR